MDSFLKIGLIKHVSENHRRAQILYTVGAENEFNK